VFGGSVFARSFFVRPFGQRDRRRMESLVLLGQPSLAPRGNPTAKIIVFDPKDKFSKQTLFEEGWRQHYSGMIEWVGGYFGKWRSDQGGRLQRHPRDEGRPDRGDCRPHRGQRLVPDRSRLDAERDGPECLGAGRRHDRRRHV
jgi:hypothetical protein